MVKLCESRKLVNCLRSYLFPNLFPIAMLECGYNRSSEFVWAKLKKQEQHKFKPVNTIVTYGTEVVVFVEKGRLRNGTGVKAKEVFLQVNVSDIVIKDPSSGKIKFKATNGLPHPLPASAFEPEEDEAVDQKN